MRVNNISFAYSNDTSIFERFDFESNDKYLFFQGRSGCGKSTLLKLLTDNLQPAAGSIYPVPSEAQSCLILQEDGLFPWLTGIENISLMLDNVQISDIENSPVFDYAKSFIHKKAYQLSFGQRRIIELFRGVLYEPKILCLDEPFNYLDENSRSLMSEIIFNPHISSKISQIIMTTHYDSDISNIKNVEYANYYFNGQMPYHSLEKRK